MVHALAVDQHQRGPARQAAQRRGLVAERERTDHVGKADVADAVVRGDEIQDLHRVLRAAAVDLVAADGLHGQCALAFDALDVGSGDLDLDVHGQSRSGAKRRASRRSRLPDAGAAIRCACCSCGDSPNEWSTGTPTGVDRRPAASVCSVPSGNWYSQSLVGQRRGAVGEGRTGGGEASPDAGDLLRFGGPAGEKMSKGAFLGDWGSPLEVWMRRFDRRHGIASGSATLR